MYVQKERLPIQPEDVYFESTDGTRLHGWFFPAKGKAVGAILHFHGNAQNLTSHFAFLRKAPQENFHHFIFDYRGYGLSEGKPNPHGLVEDGKAALNWLAAKYPGLPIIVFGQSLGGAIALKTMIENRASVPVRLVVVDSTFASYRSEARKVMANHWLTWILSPIAWLIVDNSEAPGDDVKKIAPTPLIVVHGDKDQVVDFSLGKDLFDRAEQPKEFWQIPSGHHTEFLWRPEFEKKFYEALKKAVQ